MRISDWSSDVCSSDLGGRRRMDYLSEPFLIDGRWQAASGTRFGAVTNPANGMQIGKLAFAETGELDAALSAAQRGFDAWKRVPAFERYTTLRMAAALVRQRGEDIPACIPREQGEHEESRGGKAR